MKLNKLKEFLNVAYELSDEVKDMEVDMFSDKEPSYKTCGCHAGLVSIIAKDLPELQEIYNNHDDYQKNQYGYKNWADSLAVFLGFKSKIYLERWAYDNEEIWENKNGASLFESKIAFTNDRSKKIRHRDIINHWQRVGLNMI